MASKAERQEQRIRQAEMRNRAQRICCATIAACNRWMFAGQTLMDSSYPAIDDVPQKELKKILAQIQKFEKHRDEWMRSMDWSKIQSHDKHGKPQISTAFHTSVIEGVLRVWCDSIDKFVTNLPSTDVSRVLLYLAIMAVHDICRIDDVEGREVNWMLQTGNTLAYMVIPPDRWDLIMILSEAYFDSRDKILMDPEWVDFPDKKTKAEEDLEKADPNDPVCNALKDWRAHTSKSIMRLKESA